MGKIFVVVILLGMLCTVGVAQPVNPRLAELLSQLNLDHPGLEKVKAAATPDEKQKALFEYYRNRRIPVLQELGSDDDRAEHQRVADNALKHIFTGQLSYPAQPRGQEIDWDSEPVPDPEWLWQFHRFIWWDALTNTYVKTQDERYAREWMLEVNSWVAHMHKAEHFRRHPGWRSLEVGIRMMLWPPAFERFMLSPSMDETTLVNYLWSIQIHADLTDEKYPPRGKGRGRIGNFELNQQVGLLTVAALYPEFKDSPTYAKRAIERLIAYQKVLILPDGVINEYVPSYHTGNPTKFSWVKKLVKKYGISVTFPAGYDQAIEKSIDAMLTWSHPDGTSPLFGDAWLGNQDRNRRWVGNFLQDFNRPDWLFFASSGAKGSAPQGKIRHLPDGGYSSMRSDWTAEALFLVAKNTNPQQHQWHNHNDNLSFELSAYGRRFMTDSGCYNYYGEPDWRDWFRRPQAHQMITVDDQPVASRGKTILLKSIPGLDVMVLENQAGESFAHRRSFLMVEDRFWVVVDRVSGDVRGTVRQHFQLDPSPFVLDVERKSARTAYETGPNLLVLTARNPQVRLSAEEGWFSPKYMEKKTRPAFAFAQEKRDAAPCYFLTMLLPLKKENQLLDFQLGFVKDGKLTSEPSNTIYVRLNFDEHYLLTVDAEKGQLSAQKFITETRFGRESVLFKNGTIKQSGVPDFSMVPDMALKYPVMLRLNIFNAPKSSVEFIDQQVPRGTITPISWGSESFRKSGTIMQSELLGTEPREVEFRLMPSQNGTLQITFLGNDFRMKGKRIPRWVEFSEITFEGALNATELAAATNKPIRVWHNAQRVFPVKVQKGHALIIRCRARGLAECEVTPAK